MNENLEPICEGCGAPATTSDSEGISLCQNCYQAAAEQPPATDTAPRGEQWTVEKLSEITGVTKHTDELNFPKLADKINAALAAAVESAVVHPAELITKMAKLEQQLAAEREKRKDTERKLRITCRAYNALDKELAACAAAIAEALRLPWTDVGIVLAPIDLSALDRHDAKVRKPLVKALEDASKMLSEIRNAPGTTLNPYSLSSRAYETQQRIDDALANIK